MMFEIWEPISRSIIVFLVVFILTRILGQKQISQLTFFDYVAGTTLGSLAASAMANNMIPLLTDMLCFITWTGLIILLNISRLSSMPARKILQGQPRLVIRNGKILEETLHDGFYHINDLLAQLREKEVFDPSEIEIGIMETNGQLSILKKSPYQPVTAKSAHMQSSAQSTKQFDAKELVIDGKIQQQNLAVCGLTENWLKQQLQAQNITDLKQVTLALLTPAGTVYVDKRADDASKSIPPS